MSGLDLSWDVILIPYACITEEDFCICVSTLPSHRNMLLKVYIFHIVCDEKVQIVGSMQTEIITFYTLYSHMFGLDFVQSC